LGSSSIDLKTSVEDSFPKIQQAIGNSGYQVKSVVPNQTIMAEGSREFSWIWVIVFAILLWPVAILYYFTRQRSSVTVVTGKTEDGCKVTITSNGKTGDEVLQSIVHALESKSQTKS